MNRNLDGVYFRVQRNDGFENICFSDLTEEEQNEMMESKDELWLKSMCRHLASVIKDIGDQFNIVAKLSDGEEVKEEQ